MICYSDVNVTLFFTSKQSWLTVKDGHHAI